MTQVLLFNVFNGLIVGAFYALMALGLSLILNLSGVINFAHGGFLAIGAYLAYSLMPFIGFWGALLVAPFLTAAIGLAVERVLIRRLYGRDPLYSLLLTFGLAYILEDATRYIYGAQSVPYPIPAMADDAAQRAVLLPDGLSPVHGRAGWHCGDCTIFDPESNPPRHADPGRHARSRDRFGAGRQRADTAQSQFRPRHLISPASPACSRPACSACSRRSALR